MHDIDTASGIAHSNSIASKMLYDAAKGPFRELLYGAGVSKATVARLEIDAVVHSATQFMAYNGGILCGHIIAKDLVQISAACTHLLQVGCDYGTAMDASERDKIALVAMIMPALSAREDVAVLNSLANAKLHMAHQFPTDITSVEAKAEYSVNLMFVEYEKLHPGVVLASTRFATKLLNPILDFALYKAGKGQLAHTIATHPPNFSRIAMRAGTSLEHVGGTDSKLLHQIDGADVLPSSITQVGKYWHSWLRQVFAMTQVKLPDGTFYGQEAGFAILESCYSDYAGSRPTVAAICSALTEGWKKFVDNLTISNDSFVEVCRQAHTADKWVEAGDVVKRKLEADENNTVKQLKSQLAIEKAKNSSPRNSDRRATFEDERRAQPSPLSDRPCFDFFAGKPCRSRPCPFRHNGQPPSFNPASSPARPAGRPPTRSFN